MTCPEWHSPTSCATMARRSKLFGSTSTTAVTKVSVIGPRFLEGQPGVGNRSWAGSIHRGKRSDYLPYMIRLKPSFVPVVIPSPLTRTATPVQTLMWSGTISHASLRPTEVRSTHFTLVNRDNLTKPRMRALSRNAQKPHIEHSNTT